MALEERKTRKYGVAVDENEGVGVGILSRFREPVYRSKFFRWMWLPCAMFALGVVISQGGPTILDLQIITDTDEETSSFFFTSASGGYLLGSFVTGAIHGKISNNIVMAVVTVMSGALTVATPYCTSFVSMLVIRGAAGVFLGGIDCTINTEHMHIWGTEGQALLQLTHFSFAIGGVIGPLFAAPFLAEKNKTITGWDLNVTSDLNLTMRSDLSTRRPASSGMPLTTDVHYAYLIGGVVAAVSAIPFLVMLMCSKKSSDSQTKHEGEEEEDSKARRRVLPACVHIFMTTILCAFYVAYCCIENTFSSYLETFLVNQFDQVSKEQAAYITTYYWAAFAAGRFTGIFTSKCLIAVRLLYLHFCLMFCAFLGFVLSAFYGQIDAITAFTCLVGVSLSSVYPAGFSWTEAELMKVTGTISGIILIGSSIGSMINPFIMGYLMKHESNLWFCYFLAGSVVVTCSLFIFLLLFNRCLINKIYGRLDQDRSSEKQTTDLPMKSLQAIM